MNGNNQKTITPRIVIEAVLKWHWIIVVTFSLSALAGIVLVVKLPKLYEAKTVILVQPQKVPTSIVRDIVSSNINDRINTLSQRILSRTNIENIIEKFKLFSSAKYDKMFMEKKVDLIRDMISVKLEKGRRSIDAFSISFRGKDPAIVQQIANYLATSFIDENLKLREVQVLGTNAFLEDELSAMRKKLIAHENNLKTYREKYMGGLPGQLNSNLRILDTLNDQLATITAGMANANERIALIEKYNSDLSRVSGSDIDDSGRPGSKEEMLALLETYRNRYTEWHPDVIRLKKMIEKEEQVLKNDKTSETGSGENNSGVEVRATAEIMNQKNSILSEIKRMKNEKSELLKQISLYKKRVEDTPKREQELMSLQRDYDNIKSTYDSLLARQLEAQIAVNMEKKQKGEQFRVLDPARLPQAPVSPNINKLFVFVMAAGIGLGGGIIFLLEFLNSSLCGAEDVENYLNIPVVATIPVIVLPGDIRRRAFRKKLSILGTATAFMLFGGFVYTIVVMG